MKTKISDLPSSSKKEIAKYIQDCLIDCDHSLRDSTQPDESVPYIGVWFIHLYNMKFSSGNTACCVCIHDESVICVNVGDSRSVATYCHDNQVDSIPLSFDQTPFRSVGCYGNPFLLLGWTRTCETMWWWD